MFGPLLVLQVTKPHVSSVMSTSLASRSCSKDATVGVDGLAAVFPTPELGPWPDCSGENMATVGVFEGAIASSEVAELLGIRSHGSSIKVNSVRRTSA